MAEALALSVALASPSFCFSRYMLHIRLLSQSRSGHTDFQQYPLYQVIYNLYLHPLAHIPGPRSWSASRLPFIRSLVSGTIVQDIEKLHRKYGPILRIAPNEITFAKAEAWADIFSPRPGHLQFPKDPVWWARQPGQPESLLSVPTAEGHARMRKLLSPGFTQRALKMQEPIVQKYVGLLIERLRERSTAPDQTDREKGVVLDIVPWFNYTTFDIFGDLGFGESFDCLEHSRYHPWIALLFNSVKAASFVIATRFYPLINFLLMKCIPKSILKMQRDHYLQIVDKVERRLNWEVERTDFMSHVIKSNNEKEMTLGEIQATFMILTTAGSETTATVLSGTLNYLTAYPDKLAILIKEVRSSFASEGEITLDALSNLPYLNAVISEGLRLCPPVPIMLPRLVPEGGDAVCGVWMPGGVSHGHSHDRAWPTYQSRTRQASRYRAGHSFGTHHASTTLFPSSLSVGCPKPWKSRHRLLTISDMQCKRSAWARGAAWADTWPGQRCG